MERQRDRKHMGKRGKERQIERVKGRKKEEQVNNF
jgi:hypothetical protein